MKLNVETGAFKALQDRVTELEAALGRIERGFAVMDIVRAASFEEGRASVLDRSASTRPRSRPRHLRVAD